VIRLHLFVRKLLFPQPPICAKRRQAAVSIRNSWTCFSFCEYFSETWFKRNNNRTVFVILFHCWRETKIWSTENNVRPNRDDNDHVLIITIDVDLGSERTIKYIEWRDIKSDKIRSGASRARRVMIILNKLFMRQFESNSLYSTEKNVVITFSDTVALYMHSGNDKSYLAPDYERYSRPSTPTRSVGHYLKWFCTGRSVFDI
jgi:hypothetical protein